MARENKEDMRKLIIWDFNGTIIDDTQACLNIEIKMLKDRNMKHDYTIDDYRNLFCFPVINYYYLLGYTFEKESYKEISDEFNVEYDAVFPTLPLMPDFLSKIQESIDKGYKNVILSATLQSTLEEELKILKIDQYFDELIGVDDNMAFSKVEHAKRWIKENNIDPKECFYIGDTTHDAETSTAIGVEDFVLVSSGHQSYEVLKKHSPGHVVHTLKEVKL